MANYFPLIANSAAAQVQEIPSGDFLDLSDSGIANSGNITVTGVVSATGNITGANLLPPSDNSGVVGTSALTWNNGQFTNLTVDGTLSVRAAIDLADSDILQFGTSDDTKMFYDGTNNTMEMELESSAVSFIITDNGTTRFTFEKSSGNVTATNFLGVASSAKYADLAERYQADRALAPGTVVIFGGDSEITVTDQDHDTRIAGVVSTDPAYLMNSDLEAEHAVAVALQGRAPCRVIGRIRKGDCVVSSTQPGVAQALDHDRYRPGCIIGKALQDYDSPSPGTIEVVIGRL